MLAKSQAMDANMESIPAQGVLVQTSSNNARNVCIWEFTGWNFDWCSQAVNARVDPATQRNLTHMEHMEI